MRLFFHILFGLFCLYATAIANPYQVDNITTTISGNESHLLRETAQAQATEKAWYTLLSRLTDREKDALPTITEKDLNKMVEGYETQSEKITATHYTSVTNVVFRTHKVRHYLRNRNIPFHEDRVVITMVIPITYDRAKERFYKGEDRWFKSWQQYALTNSNPPLRVLPFYAAPLKHDDVEAFMEMPTSEAHYGFLKRLFQHYRYQPILLPILQRRTDHVDLGSEVLCAYIKDGKLSVANLSEDQLFDESQSRDIAFMLSQIESFMGDFDGTKMQASPKISEATAPKLVEDAPDIQPSRDYSFIVPIVGIAQWNDIEAVLKTVPLIENIHVDSLSAKTVTVTLTTPLSYDGLRLSLIEKNLSVFQRGRKHPILTNMVTR